MFENYYESISAYLPYFCTTPCVIEFAVKGLDEDGCKKKVPKVNAKCIYQCKVQRTHDNKGVSTSSSGACYFAGDIFPESELLEGKIQISNIPHAFKFKGEKQRDNEGKVRYTLFTLE